MSSKSVKHFLQFKDLNRDEFEYLFERTRIIKQKFKAYQQYWPLQDRTLVMIFEKASTRTRLSLQAAPLTAYGYCPVTPCATRWRSAIRPG